MAGTALAAGVLTVAATLSLGLAAVGGGGGSDDANSHVVHEGAVHLRVSKIGSVFAFHSSVDGSTWDFVRAFALEEGDAEVRVGFEAQSPMGEGCDVRFDSIRSSETTLSDLRDGT